MSTPLIGVDWGTTNLRAFRFGADGAVLETRRDDAGLKNVPNREFEATLRGVIGDWLDAGATRVVMCGMVGSREGWVEAPYLPCPADAVTLSRAMIRAPAAFEAWITPGLSIAHPDNLMDVMRGEETQIFGALRDRAPHLIIAPGTHSKWARVAQGRIKKFHTYMTGEMFAVLKTHSILGKLMEGDEHDTDAFALGVRRGQASSALLHLLFTVRSEGLFAHVAPRALASYLSGLLIGSEITEGLALHQIERDSAVLIIGAGTIAALYQTALELAGAQSVDRLDGEEAAARGLWSLAQAKDAA